MRAILAIAASVISMSVPNLDEGFDFDALASGNSIEVSGSRGPSSGDSGEGLNNAPGVTSTAEPRGNRISHNCSRIVSMPLHGTDHGIQVCLRPGESVNIAQALSYLNLADLPAIDPVTGEPAAPDTPVIVVGQRELQSLPIQTGTLEIQPPGGTALINQPVIAHSTAAPHTLSTVILGVPVDVRLAPLTWQWDFADGTGAFTTDHPGAPYPDKSVTGTYTHAAEGNRVTLTVTWMGEYRVGGAGPWLLVDGNATTSLTSEPFATVEAPVRLVSEPLD